MNKIFTMGEEEDFTFTCFWVNRNIICICFWREGADTQGIAMHVFMMMVIRENKAA